MAALRPQKLQPSRSFTRLDAAPASAQSRSRASTLQGPHVPDMLDPLTLSANTVVEEDEPADADVFAKTHDGHDVASTDATPDSFEELPIEIRSLTERFLESLTAKVHPAPLSIDNLSDLFQDFYARASAKINTHIATLSARLTSDEYQSKKSPAPSSRPGSIRTASSHSGEQQMLSASEMADRKKARKSLETKRLALEEAVERAACENMYSKIWRHRSTDDEERDHKLRSRTAALSLVGIGLKELLMTGDELTEEERKKTKEKEPEIREWLSAARQDIMKMNDEKYPQGKVQHLTAVHKSIVEALSKIFPATSSADEILPTLIYTLITLPPVYLNVVGDLMFIQRFRGSSRMDGETAYCLVNLEAAISFLETVDLSSLRANEPAVPAKADSRPSTPRSEMTPMALGLSDAPDLMQIPPTPTTTDAPTEPSSPVTTKAQRRLSNLIQTQQTKLEAASDAVRDSILDSADQALGRINNTLDTSFKFFFGGLRDRNPNSPIIEQPALPKTLEDARKLVSSPTHLDDDDDASSVGAASSAQGDDRHDISSSKRLDAKMSDLFAGRKQIRERSADSTRSGGSASGRRVTFPATVEEKTASPAAVKTEPPAPSSTSAVDSLRSMGNSLNPLNRFANMTVLPRFGRAMSSSSSSTPPVLSTPVAEHAKQLPSPEGPSRTVTGESTQVDGKGAKAMAAIEQLKKTPPPVKRFLDAKDAQDLKLKEVDELLREYQRLATAMRSAMNH
ncbi:hypothetical protein ACEQ8H_007658 [Pleosporales sp. CAS-2024a]